MSFTDPTAFALTPPTISPPSFPVKADERGAVRTHPDAIPDKPAAIVLEVKSTTESE